MEEVSVSVSSSFIPVNRSKVSVILKTFVLISVYISLKLDTFDSFFLTEISIYS